MGAGGGFSKSSADAASDVGSLSLLPALFGQLFGLDSRSRQGGFGFAKTDPGEFQFFTPDQQLSPDMFDPQAAFAPQLTDGIFDIDKAAAGINRAVDAGFDQLATGGLGAATDNFMNIFKERIMPETLDRFGQFGLSMNDSDTRAALAREGSLAATQLAEGAANRQAQAIAATPGLVAALPGMENTLRQTIRSRDPGVQTLQQLFSFGGFNTQGQNTSTSRSDSMSANASVGAKPA